MEYEALPYIETELVLLAQAGDRQALEELLAAVYPALRRYVATLTGATSADDVVQDTIIQAYRKLGWLDEPAYFRPWLYRIASRQAFAHLRKTKRWQGLDDDGSGPELTAHPAHLEVEWTSTLDSLLDRVSPASRAALELHYGQSLTIEEVAAVLEVPIGTVKSRLSYGVSTLRRFLKEQAQ